MLTSTWPMVSASYVPLLALVLAHLAGASGLTAANVGLGVAIAVLTFHGWSAGRAAQLHGSQLLLATSVAAGLGVVMILLKDLVLIHLHSGSKRLARRSFTGAEQRLGQPPREADEPRPGTHVAGSRGFQRRNV